MARPEILIDPLAHPRRRCPLPFLRKPINYLDDRRSQLFDIPVGQVRANIKVNSAAQKIERTGTHVRTVVHLSVVPAPWSAALRPGALFYNRAPMRVNVIVRSVLVIEHESRRAFCAKGFRDPQRSLCAWREENNRCGGVSVGIIYHSKGHAPAA